MKISMRICLEDWTITDQQGTSYTLKRGHEYTTSTNVKDGEVTVFTEYWFRAPVSIFGGEISL